MTKEKILNTPEIVDFMIDKSVMVESKMKLHKRLDELCKLAIKALEQKPCEDCISREHLLGEIASLKESPWFKENTNGAMAIRKEAIEIVEDLCIRKEPSVNPQKIGHWTIKQYHVPIENKQVPTVSGITFPTEPTACKIMYTYTHSDCRSEEYLNKFNYCPNCGAKMIEPQENEG